ncbi:MAG: dodecin family protein [Candidatus Jordarchaeum sp.]|uniref:dodecin family protein n=1 Tax=Candidatus Jordarchaeum sp. TaxID=2823881 RepID=UPI004049B5B3
MPVWKLIEIVGISDKSWEDAAKNAMDEAAKTIRNISRVSIEEFDCKVENDKIVAYRTRLKIIFEVER